MSKKLALGKGLDAIIRGQQTPPSNQPSGRIELSKIEPNPWQPRKHFNETELEELMNSIKQVGVLQPITVRPTADGRYQIVQGERRFRASQKAGFHDIPAYIIEVSDEDMQLFAIIENVQRSDLNPIEEAESYYRLMQNLNWTQEEVSEKIGKSRSAVANLLRLLKLPTNIQNALRDGSISKGHAKVLLSIEENERQKEIFQKIVNENLSVRELENTLKAPQEAPQESPSPAPSPSTQTPKEDIQPKKLPEIPQEIDDYQDVEPIEETVHNTVYVDNSSNEIVSIDASDIEYFKRGFNKYFELNVDLHSDTNGGGKMIIHIKTRNDLERLREILTLNNSSAI